ncbi:uncharacterized protein SPSK_01241 [Sporothrix schenckii 1099-18]|uniref:N-acetyltransferase domain-containing protein n=1 Tax=Sporothrix schenckii 1099-18 TaxID=1397361 RepID=A0A0F2LWR0_SPOSC|nr:uncharacterized protein SPSK_01241 [Sporothrix schenckii 1099-18]KJR81269.1 hypothetical protein SPSK_01241 [Sporothrix schenckii 1099-18]
MATKNPAPAGSVPFSVFVSRPSTEAYEVRFSPQDQPRAAEIDPTFLDAMKVRHNVFIMEQKVPLESELDEDDMRSVHWVAYMSDGGDNTSQQAVGTIRVVPYPQPPHPMPGGAYSIIDGAVVLKGRWVRKSEQWLDSKDAAAAAAAPPLHTMPRSQLEYLPATEADLAAEIEAAIGPDRATSLHDGKEPYVKLGRIAVLSSFRGFHLGQYLVQTALDWIQENPTYFDKVDPMAAAATTETKFNGLVCLHAQVHALGFYQRLGFVVDEGMGTWWEEGIPHVGMFRRLELSKKAL